MWAVGHTSPTYYRYLPGVWASTAWWQAHVCEQLAQSHYLTVERLGIEPATCRLLVRRRNHCTTKPHDKYRKYRNISTQLKFIRNKVAGRLKDTHGKNVDKQTNKTMKHNRSLHMCHVYAMDTTTKSDLCVWWWHYLWTNQTVAEVYLSSALHLITQFSFCTLHSTALPDAMQRQCHR